MYDLKGDTTEAKQSILSPQNAIVPSLPPVLDP